MLRRRSIGMSSNQAFNGCAEKQIKPFLGSPRFFAGFCVKSCSEIESSVIMSPTSTLDSKSYAAFANPFWSGNTTASRLSPEPCLETNKQHHPLEEEKKKKRIGLAIVDALISDEETNKNLSKPETRMVVFGSHLKIQIPSLPSSSSSGSPKSPADFGIKTRTSLPLSPCSAKTVLLASLSATEMELSEDYTCVISRGGPNPKTTHIFGDCIVEDCCGVMVLSDSNKEACFSVHSSHYSSHTYLSFCYNCNNKIVQGQDIYMYRGEKAFCSGECRFKEMSFDEGTEKPNMKDSVRTSS